jgi:hypothetical protein
MIDNCMLVVCTRVTNTKINISTKFRYTHMRVYIYNTKFSIRICVYGDTTRVQL